MANLSKGRDAKPWVYHPASRGQDSQVAEDEIIETLREPGDLPGSFCLNFIIQAIRSIKANLSKGRDAKPWVYHPASRGQDCQVTESASKVRQASLSAFIEVETSMTLNAQLHRTALNASLLLVLFVSIFVNPIPAQALESVQALPDFSEFSKAVQNNQAGVLRGVYVSDVLALPIVQQPVGNAGFVSFNEGEITQFGMASQFGNVGLLAHNNLSGRLFSNLAVGQEVRLVYGDGKVEYFVIKQISKYQAMQPTSPYSSFRDLANDEQLTAEQLFNKVYRGDRHVTFQTCIEAFGNLSWGRLFVVAEPRSHYSGFNRFEGQ